MSRNVRNHTKAIPAKVLARRASTQTNNSSDDDYAGVDLISDTEEDEPDVEVAEEQAIIESADDNDDLNTPRPSMEDTWEGFSPEFVEGENSFFQENIARGRSPNMEAARLTSFEEVLEKHVRFASTPTLSDHDEDINGFWPDANLFMDQSSLAPQFRQAIENDDDEVYASEDGGYWDFQATEASPAAFGENLDEEDEDDDEDESSTEGSGYETDDGDTTEEEEEEVIELRREAIKSVLEEEEGEVIQRRRGAVKSVLRRQSTDSSSEEEMTISRRTMPRNGPRLKWWTARKDKPFLALNTRNGFEILVYDVQIPRRYSFNDVPQLTYQQYAPLQADTAGSRIDSSPMFSNSANLMMSALHGQTQFDQFMSGFGGQIVGPPEAFHPFTSIDVNGDITRDSTSSFDEDDIDDDESPLMEEFINFEEDSSVDGLEEDDSSPTDEGPRPTTANSEDQVHMFDSNLVGSFRKHQNNHNLMTRHNVTEDSLMFAGPYAATSIRGIRDGRIPAANTPITPLRKQKAPMDSSPSKRKFSGEQQGHKRSKSLI